MLYYINDSSLRAARNAAGEDYTPAYIPAMLKFMGMTGCEIAPDALSTLQKEDVVLVGADGTADVASAATLIQLGVPQPAVPERRRQVYGSYVTKSGCAVPLFVPICASDATPDEVLAYAEVQGERVPALVRQGKDYQFMFDLPATLWFSGDGFMEMQNPPRMRSSSPTTIFCFWSWRRCCVRWAVPACIVCRPWPTALCRIWCCIFPVTMTAAA